MTRWAPLAGIAFVIVFVATGVAVQDVPPAGSTDAEIRSYFTDHDNQLKVDLSTLAFTLSALLLIWGVAGITARLRTTRDGDLLRGVALVSGGAAAAVLVVGAALGAVVADTSNDTGRFVLDPNTTRLLTDVSYTLMFEVAFPLARAVFDRRRPRGPAERAAAALAGLGGLRRGARLPAGLDRRLGRLPSVARRRVLRADSRGREGHRGRRADRRRCWLGAFAA